MSAKDDILGINAVPTNRFGAPPIDSSLQSGSPSPVVQKSVQPTQPVQQVQPQPNVGSVPPPIDSSLQGAPGLQRMAQPSTGNNESSSKTTKPADAATGKEDDESSRLKAWYDEYKAKKDKDLGDLISTMDKMAGTYKPQTEEEMEKERKKRKRDAIFNSIGDGIQALSNLYFTTRYAPNSYDPANSLSARARARWDKLDKERESDRDKYFNILLNKYRLQDATGKDDMGWKKYFEEIKDRRNAAKAKAEADALAAGLKQFNADRDYKLKKDALDAKNKNNTTTNEEKHRHNLAMERKSTSKGGKGGASKARYTLNIGGKIYSYGSQADYQRAVQRYAKAKNLNPLQSIPDGTDVFGRPKKKTRTKPVSQLAAEVENAYAGKSQGKSNGKKLRIKW